MTLLELARLSRMVYGHNDIINSDSGLKNLEITEVKDYKYFIGESDDAIIIAIRGSANVDNWANNLKFKSKKGIHMGFEHGRIIILDSLAKKKALSYDNKKIIITGHSLGSALSLLVGDTLTSMGYQDVKVVGFESPRAVKKDKAINVDFTSTIVAGDLVTGSPSKRLGYKTVGTKIYFNNKGNLAKFNPFHLIKASILGWTKKKYGFSESHSISTVINNIIKNKDKLIKKGLWLF